MSHTSTPQECPTRVFHNSVPQKCPTTVNYKSVPQNLRVPQECSTRVSDKSAPRKCLTRVSDKSVVQECPTDPTRVSYKSFSQQCPAKCRAALLVKSTRSQRSRAFLPKFSRQVSKTSVSHEASSKTHTVKACETSVLYKTSSAIHASSLQNKRFVRDLLKKVTKSHMSKSPKRALRTRQAGRPIGHTHQAALPSSFAIPAPPNNARSRANPNVTGSFTSTATRNLTIPCARRQNLPPHPPTRAEVERLRFPAPATKVVENRRKVLRLPRKVAISFHVSFSKDCYHSTRLVCFRHVLSTLPTSKIATLVETCHENTASKQRA